MPIQGNISPRIIQSISSLYSDSNRVILEFIDNSIDSAEKYFDTSNNKYTRPIKITLEVLGNTNKDGSVVISDNCEGIVNLEKIVQSFGNSRKRGQAETNGKFGFGMCSFLASCGELEILTKIEKEGAEKITILKEHFEVDNHEDFLFSNIQKVKNFPCESGTVIQLKTFEKNSWKDLNIEFIKSEIEKHFELLLNRENLEIKLIGKNKEYVCQPFNYSSFEGKELDELIIGLPNLKKPVHIFLKVIKGKDLSKRPVFVIKGRRINEIKEIKAFKSDFKSEIWNHPNITGYVDLGDYIEPDISRNGFSADCREETKALFDVLISKEPQILDLIRESNEETQDRHYQKLEDILSKALSKIARSDAMNFRTEYLAGHDVSLEKGAIGKGSEMPNFVSTGTNSTASSSHSGNSVDGKDPDDQPGGENSLDKESENPFDDKDPQGSERKKSGFNIKISDREPDIDVETNEKIRSRLLGNTIEIFKKHPDFEVRVSHFQGGEPKISQRLITYLAGEITIHYKDRFYMKSGQPEYNKKMFESLVNSIYMFEDLLKDYVGQNFSKWNNQE